MKTLAYIKAHVFTKELVEEYKKMKNTNVDAIVVFDDKNYDYHYGISENVVTVEMFGEKVDVLFTDMDLFEKYNLPGFYNDKENRNANEFMWYNSDYQFYIVRKILPQYDYYWQSEYDVFCNGDSYQEFFDDYKDSKSDFIAVTFARAKKTWWAVKKVKWIYDKNTELGCSIFPLVRLSKEAVDYLYKRRLEHAEVYKRKYTKPRTRWVFCEAFVGTEIGNHKTFTGELIRNQHVMPPNKKVDFDEITKKPDNKLYHPVKFPNTKSHKFSGHMVSFMVNCEN